MEWWHVLVGGVFVVGALGALYGLHRVCLWLEARGLLYYWHKKPSSSAAACFVALQQALEPPTRHVQHVKEEKRHHSEEDGAFGEITDSNCPVASIESSLSRYWCRLRALLWHVHHDSET